MVSPVFVATLLRTSADGFAGLAASKLASDPNDAPRFGEWKAHLRSQVLDLASAVEVEEPERYARRVAWARDAFLARSVDPSVPRAAFSALTEVLEESLPTEAWEALPTFLRRARHELEQLPAPAASLLVGDSDAAALSRDYLEALLDGDEARASTLLLESVDSEQMSPEVVLEEVLTPVQREIGRLWHAGEISIADEHFATMVARKLVVRLTPVAQVSVERTVVTAGVAGDAHDLGVSIVAAFFQLAGWRTICLGGDVPVEDLGAIADRFDADVVALAATLDSHYPAVRASIEKLRTVRQDQIVLVGGAAFSGEDEVWRKLGADGCPATPRAAVGMAEQLRAARSKGA